MRDYRKLTVWKKSHQLVLNVYQATKDFPSDERYGLTSQMRRSAQSIPTNIAEGAGRSTDGDFVRFLDIAAGSASELDYQLLLAHDLAFLDTRTHEVLIEHLTEVRKMLTAFIRKLRATK